MIVTALVMAGGKATRMDSEVEKPMLQINGVPMIQLLLETLQHSKYVSRTVVAVTSSDSQTAKKARELGAEVVETPGEGFEEDMKIAIKKQSLSDVLVVSADLPFMTTTMVDKAIEAYKSSHKPALTVMCPLNIFQKSTMQPTHVFRVGDEPVLDEKVLISESEELALNVNTPQELKIAREFAKKRNSLVSL
jgi:adenosylcobinamide-phosphate guanylyltransferase